MKTLPLSNLWFLMMIGVREGGVFGLYYRLMLTVIAAGVILAVMFCPLTLFPQLGRPRV